MQERQAEALVRSCEGPVMTQIGSGAGTDGIADLRADLRAELARSAASLSARIRSLEVNRMRPLAEEPPIGGRFEELEAEVRRTNQMLTTFLKSGRQRSPSNASRAESGCSLVRADAKEAVKPPAKALCGMARAEADFTRGPDSKGANAQKIEQRLQAAGFVTKEAAVYAACSPFQQVELSGTAEQMVEIVSPQMVEAVSPSSTPFVGADRVRTKTPSVEATHEESETRALTTQPLLNPEADVRSSALALHPKVAPNQRPVEDFALNAHPDSSSRALSADFALNASLSAATDASSRCRSVEGSVAVKPGVIEIPVESLSPPSQPRSAPESPTLGGGPRLVPSTMHVGFIPPCPESTAMPQLSVAQSQPEAPPAAAGRSDGSGARTQIFSFPDQMGATGYPAAPSRPGARQPEGGPGQSWRVLYSDRFYGAIVREGVEVSSKELHVIPPAEVCIQRGPVVELPDGIVRMPIEPDGWVTVHARHVDGPTFMVPNLPEQVRYVGST